MANSRELAEQAFTLLQDALRESEARASELDAELRRRSASATPLDEQISVLTRRLEQVEAERERWQREASRIEEMYGAEHAKSAQLRKKLDIAESGPEKLTKKEINFWRAKAEDIGVETKEYRARLAALHKELVDRDLLIDQLKRDGVASAPGDGAISHEDADADTGPEIDVLRRQVTGFEAALADAHMLRDSLEGDLERTQTELAEQQRNIREAQSTSERNREMVSEREHRLIEVSAEVEHLRTEVEQNQTREQQLRDEAIELRERVALVSSELEAARLLQNEQRSAEQHSADEHLRAVIAEREQQLADNERELVERNQQLTESTQQLSERAQELSERDQQLAVRNEELAEVAAELELLRGLNAELEIQKQQMRDQMFGMESELKEEKENTDNLSEVANERRERITKLNEQIEEATERYEEAKWRLGKAQYFERVVVRRKGLIKGLLAALRAKSKSNIALKAGLDGLRVHKATAELNQQKLLARIDSLKVDLEEAEETIERHHGATMAKEQLATTEARVVDLTTRLNTQAELIQSLEDDLKKARGLQKSSEEKSAEIDRLRGELAARSQELEDKQQIVNQLLADADEQQRRLSKLRGSESETVRLKAISEQDRSVRDALEREVAQLRETLTHQSHKGDGTGEYRSGDELARLLTTVKEHEATIKKLGEAAEAWKRKYQFLATETPDAFKTVVEK